MARFILLALLAAPCAAWLAPLAPRRASVRVRSAVTAEAVEFARKSAEDASEHFGKKSAAAAAKIAEITRAAASSRRSIGQVRSGLEAMKDVKLSDFAGSAKAGAAKVDDLQYKAAKAAAEAAVSEHGKDSAEARAAWDIVSEIEANAGPSEATYAGLDEECLLETMQLCETFDAALDSLQKSINQQK